MLVLTTMFINVSNNLPKTSYMKMVDVWLLFNLLLPFIVVLIHTYMDTLRNDEDREINHHGKAIQINEEKQAGSMIQVAPAKMALVSVNEEEERRAQKEFYEKVASEMGKKKAKKLAFWKRVSLVYIPIFALVFISVYWVAGLKHANVI